MGTKKSPLPSAEDIRGQLKKVVKNSPAPIIQEVAKPEPIKKIGRKSHALEGVEYARIGVKIPANIKTEMVVAMATTHKEYPTMDLFIAEAMRVFLSLKR